jgi:glycosyltransferase involved in cell wall biosynthesis
MNVSVVVVTYRRLDRLGEVLQAWLNETPDVWLCDCSKEGFKTDLPIHIVRAWPDPGSKIRHAVALLTEGDYVIKADDDIKPLPGLVKDFLKCGFKLAIMGVHGRNFLGPDYYKDTVMITGRDISELTPVDFLGLITCSPRRYLAMDLRGCESAIEDLYWLNYYNNETPKIVIPTKNYEILPSSKDPLRLCANRAARAYRQEFYRQCFEEFYK